MVFDLVVQAPSLWPPIRALALTGQAALAPCMLRAEAHGETLSTLILAALNQALLDGLNDGQRFLTAIYATVGLQRRSL